MALTPFWQHFLVALVAAVFVAAFVWRPLARRRRRPSQLGEILRRLSEEREAERRSGAGLRPGDDALRGNVVPSGDHDLAGLDDRR